MNALRDTPDSPFITDFNRVIRGLSPLSLSKLKAREPACIRALLGCRSGAKADVVNALQPFASRQITEEAEWVYDDFLLFAMLCAFVRFGEFRDTVANLIGFRRRSEQPAGTAFLHDAERISRTGSLDGGGMYEIAIADILERQVENPAAVRGAWRQATQARMGSRLSTFEDAMSRRIGEIALEMSIASTAPSSVVARHVWRRCRGAAIAVYSVCLLAIGVATGWMIWTYFLGADKPSSIAEKLVSMGALGVLTGMWRTRTRIVLAGSYFFLWLISGNRAVRAMRALNGEAREHASAIQTGRPNTKSS